MLLALSRYDSALDVLRAANQRPKVRYPIAYEDGLFALHRRHEHFEENLRIAVRILCLRAVAELAQDRSDAALQDTLLALRLADSLVASTTRCPTRFRKRALRCSIRN